MISRKKHHADLAAWLVGWEAEYVRDPKAFDAAFEGIARLKKRCAHPLSPKEKYQRMTADEKFAWRVEVCKRAEELVSSGESFRGFAWDFGVSAMTLRRWMARYRAGGEAALRFDYSGVGRKKSGERRP